MRELRAKVIIYADPSEIHLSEPIWTAQVLLDNPFCIFAPVPVTSTCCYGRPAFPTGTTKSWVAASRFVCTGS